MKTEWNPTVFDALRHEPLASLSPATKLVWCFLAAQGKAVIAGDRMVREQLGLARKAVNDAMAELALLGVLEILEEPNGRSPRIVRALAPKPSR
jgi:biotin operon repressor